MAGWSSRPASRWPSSSAATRSWPRSITPTCTAATRRPRRRLKLINEAYTYLREQQALRLSPALRSGNNPRAVTTQAGYCLL